jgi:hypothetical protein
MMSQIGPIRYPIDLDDLYETMKKYKEDIKAEITEHAEKRTLEECARIDRYGKSLIGFIQAKCDDEIARLEAVGKDVEETITDRADTKQHPWYIFLEARCSMIKHLKDKGISCEEIANRLSCTSSLVARIITSCKL